MDRRLELHALLESILGSGNVYFQPPMGSRLSYPCIKYKRSNIDQQFADNKPYISRVRYQVIVISRDPDEPVVQKLAQLRMCIFDRHYTTDNLNHDSFNLYF